MKKIKSVFPSQRNLQKSLDRLQTLTQTAYLMDWEGVEPELINSFMEIQREEAQNIAAHLEQLNTDIESALSNAQNHA